MQPVVTTIPARKRHRIKHALALALAVLGVTAVTAPVTAHATAYGVQYWGPMTVNLGGQSFGIPSGQLAHLNEGAGSYVRKDAANFIAVANICNWRIDFRYSKVGDTKLVGYERNVGPTSYSCNRYGSRFTYPRANKRPGTSCAELYSNGARVARQCHSILR
jgi:hypothetical protein